MPQEIERKFLVVNDGWRARAGRTIRLRQFYLSSEGRASVRVRIVDDRAATLTVKSQGATLSRLEFEYDIPVRDAEAMASLRMGAAIEKTRNEFVHHGHRWVVDVFDGGNAGLIIAEIELKSETEPFEAPPWIGAEVTGEPHYYNSALAARPYTTWAGLARV